MRAKYRGIPVAYVAEELGVSERYARARSSRRCRQRKLVVVVDDPWTGQRRVWTPEWHKTWVTSAAQSRCRQGSLVLLHLPRTAQMPRPAR